jgi:DNA gyrase/topoisomerase IV subunit B
LQKALKVLQLAHLLEKDWEVLMEGVISYRPRMGKKKLEGLVKKKLHYKSVNQFIDHAVTKTLQEEFGHNPLAKKISDLVYKVVSEHSELKFVKPSAEETAEIEKIVEKTMAKKKMVPAKSLLKNEGKSL